MIDSEWYMPEECRDCYYADDDENYCHLFDMEIKDDDKCDEKIITNESIQEFSK